MAKDMGECDLLLGAGVESERGEGEIEGAGDRPEQSSTAPVVNYS